MYSTLLYFYCNLIAPVLLTRVNYVYILVFQPHTNNNTKAFMHSSNYVIYRVTHSGRGTLLSYNIKWKILEINIILFVHVCIFCLFWWFLNFFINFHTNYSSASLLSSCSLPSLLPQLTLYPVFRMVKSTVYSSREPGFNSQHQHGDSWLYASSVPGNLVPSHRHTCRQSTNAHKIFIILMPLPLWLTWWNLFPPSSTLTMLSNIPFTCVPILLFW